MKELLRLFNAVCVEDKIVHQHTAQTLLRGIKNGYILSPYLPAQNLDEIESVIGLGGEKANAAFHKSWTVVRDSSIEDLVAQQILHYITTYGFEAFGIFDSSTVYIPHESLEIPLPNDVPLTVVVAMSKEEVLEKILSFDGSGIAMSEQTLSDILAVVKVMKYDSDFVLGLKNRELKALLCDWYNIVPTNPTEYLRYVVSKLTDESLLIKNGYLIEKIKSGNGKFLDTLLADAPHDLASIFFRYKPLFLAMKKISNNKTFFNRLRKQATYLHKPQQPDYLNNVTGQIKQGSLLFDELDNKLDGASIFRKIRLAYALNFRLKNPESILYKVRNGRGWVADFEWGEKFNHSTQAALSIVLKSIANSLDVKGQVVYIPDTINYALPATEKQFIGNIPSGSYTTVETDTLAGIHWCNTNGRVDLDLSVIDVTGKFGWDGAYRSGSRDVLFSGDVTDAPKPRGATELFYLKNITNPKILTVNYYNFREDNPVDCKVFAAQGERSTPLKNYMVDPNNIVASANATITQKQTVLGLLCRVDGENRLYFSSAAVGDKISARNNKQSQMLIDYFVSSLINPISLRDVLVEAGAIVVSDKPTDTHLDLSCENIDKTTIIDLLMNNFRTTPLQATVC